MASKTKMTTDHDEIRRWVEKFDENGLAFLYQEHKSSGEDSTFFKLVSRDSAQRDAS